MSLPGGQLYCIYFVFKDGKKATFNSRDRRNSKSKEKDPELGCVRLLKLAQKHENASENITIYDHRPGTPADGVIIWQWNRGTILTNQLPWLT